MKSLYLYIILLLLGCSACKEGVLSPKEELPPATQEGKNTFGCLVNGEVWVPKALYNKLTFYYYEKEGTFECNAFRKIGSQDINQNLGIAISEGINIKKNHILSDYLKNGAVFNDLKSSCFYETNSQQTGLLTITKLDTINYIIAGTFDFTVWTEECDTIRVTDGRFDIKYRPVGDPK